MIQESKEARDLYGKLLCVKTTLECYEFVSIKDNRKETLKLIIENVFPYLESLIMNQLNNWNENSPQLVNLMLKCVLTSSRLEPCEYLYNEEKLKIWMNIFAQVLKTPIIQQNLMVLESQKNDDMVREIEEKQNSYEWKVKAKVSSI